MSVSSPRSSRFAHPLWIGAGLVLVAFNLRPALTSVAPVLADIGTALGFDTSIASALTTVPVLCLGLFGPVAPRLARRFGTEPSVLFALILLGSGLALRALGSMPLLFLGTVMAGAGIGIAGVLLPSIVKRDFPGQLGLLTGLYTMTLCLGAATASGISLPVGELSGLGWQGAIGFWVLPVVIAMAMWLPQLFRHRAGAVPPAPLRPASVKALLRDRRAWQVTGFMGLQSSLAYIVFGWTPTILRDGGMSPLDAGLVSSGSIVVQLITAVAVPVLAARCRDQRWLVLLVAGLSVSGFAGIVFADSLLRLFCVVLLGLGLGGIFGLALTLIVLRSPDAHVAADLSGMAQSIGYALASLGPLGAGLLRDWTGTWSVPALFFVGLASVATLCGLGAARPGHVLDPSRSNTGRHLASGLD